MIFDPVAHYGADDVLDCSQCPTGRVTVVRRSPAPGAPSLETQELACLKCHMTVTRTVNSAGETVG